mgnify:CR=1 FL=1
MTNETLATIKMRRSVRTFQAKKVSEHNIKQILQAANWAPSAHNQQSWRFIVLQDEKKQALANLVTNKANDFERPTSALLRMAARSITSAPVVIAVANTGDLIKHGMDLFKVKKRWVWIFFGPWKFKVRLLLWKTCF